jgi:tRNA threonylcarbamoyl adenosine modification protein YeaZ
MPAQIEPPSPHPSHAPRPLALAVDTCSPVLSLAAADAQGVRAVVTGEAHVPHSQALFQLLPQVLEAARIEIEDVTLFAATTGPGSFTGLRVGLAAVKGLAQARRKPLCGITTLEALAWTAAVKSATVMPLINSARGEVFYGLYRADAGGAVRQVADNAVGGFQAVLEGLRRGADSQSNALDVDAEGLGAGAVVFIGDGAAARRDGLRAAAEAAGVSFAVVAPRASLVARWNLIEDASPLAPVVARRSLALTAGGENVGAHPYYLRPADAEVNSVRVER